METMLFQVSVGNGGSGLSSDLTCVQKVSHERLPAVLLLKRSLETFHE